jgi:nucleoside 2-deoxyribosyltransferase
MVKIYLASPYSDPDPAIEEGRFQAACRKAAEIMEAGYVVFSPIAHGHPIARNGKLPKDIDYWKETDQSFIEWADELWILMLPGWLGSKGILLETEIATRLGKPIKYIMINEMPPKESVCVENKTYQEVAFIQKQ